MSRIKIAVIGLKGLPAFGGAATVGENIIMQLKDQFEFTVFSTHPYTNLNTCNYNGIKQIVFKGRDKGALTTFVYYVKSMFYCLFVKKFDLIHLHHAESGFIAPFLRMKYEIIVTFHGVYGNKIDPKFNRYANLFFRFSEKMNIKFANKVISVSDIDRNYCKMKYGREIEYIPNGINKIDYKAIDKKYEFLFIAARIYEIKGLHLLLKAIKEYKIIGKLLVIGDLNQQSAYKKQILDLSNELDVEFVPLIKNKDKLFEYIRASKIFIFPSLFEAMSMILLEVVSLKVPVIASDIEANRNIFDPEEITYFRSNDYEDLAINLSYCIHNIQSICKKAELAYTKVIEYYTWSKIGTSYSVIYNDLLK